MAAYRWGKILLSNVSIGINCAVWVFESTGIRFKTAISESIEKGLKVPSLRCSWSFKIDYL